MPLIQNIIGKLKNKDTRYSEMEKDFHAQKKLAERQLSANERELLTYKKKAHEESIKKELEGFRARQQKDWVHGNQKFLKDHNAFTDKKGAFGEGNVHQAARLS